MILTGGLRALSGMSGLHALSGSNIAPGIIIDLTVTQIDSSNIQLDWSSDPGADTYNIYKAVHGNSLVLDSSVASPTHTKTISGLSPGTTYDFDVRGVDEAGEGPPA